MTDNKMCEIYQSEPATVEITYGLYSNQKEHNKHNLCDKAAKELWDKCATLVNNGLMHWSNKKIV